MEKDIIYASTLARDIAKYQSEAAKYAVGDPKLLTIIAKTEYELISRKCRFNDIHKQYSIARR